MVCKKCKIVNGEFLRDINIKAREIAIKYNLDNRTEPLVPERPKITIKDHKENFIANLSVRLFCPNSSDLGNLSKNILGKYIQSIKDLIHLGIWFKKLDTIGLVHQV